MRKQLVAFLFALVALAAVPVAAQTPQPVGCPPRTGGVCLGAGGSPDDVNLVTDGTTYMTVSRAGAVTWPNNLTFTLPPGVVFPAVVKLSNGTAAAPPLTFVSETNLGIYRASSGKINFGVGNSNIAEFNSTGLALNVNSGKITWPLGSIMTEDAANVLACRNGTSACTVKFYNTFPGTGANEYGRLEWASNVWNILTDADGAGAQRDMRIGTNGGSKILHLRTNGTDAWQVSGTGHFLAETDNTNDIGASGGTRPRTGYFATSVQTPQLTSTSGSLSLGTGGSSVWQISSSADFLAVMDNVSDIGRTATFRPRNYFGAGTVTAAGGFSVSGVAISGTAPTIASGGCTSPAITSNNGTAKFKVTIGSSCTGVKTFTLTMPAAMNEWACDAVDLTTNATYKPEQSAAASTTSVVITNYARTTGLATDFAAGEVLIVKCTGG